MAQCGKPRESDLIPARQFLRMCRSCFRLPKVADSSGAELTGADLLVRTLVLRRLLRRHVLAQDEQYVGLLLPPSAGAVLANAALAIDRRIAINLNYTSSADVINSSISQSGIRHVLTSRRVMERLNLDIRCELVYLEDFKDQATWIDKLAAAAAARLIPVALLERWLGLGRVDPDDVLTVVFTSGSTGQPKGVMLTHRNIGSNVAAVNEVVDVRATDVLLAVLPLFHSFGYTITLWTILTTGARAIYHHNPLDARKIGQLCRQHGATILVAAPTFLRSYLKRCDPQDFATMEVLFVGAEKLPVELADAFEKKFGVRPLEGYGATELSPVASGNLPASRGPGAVRQGSKPGTVGRPLPGIEAKVIDMETGEDLGCDRLGMLLIRGPNVMKGYLGQPELTSEVMRDGWYITGDVAKIDAQGFIHITDRLSRFSKIGGEMVPHVRLEEAILSVVSPGEDRVQVAVTSVPDLRKGERLIVLHTAMDKTPADVCRQLAALGLPPLWIPSQDSFFEVAQLPVLGTGKLDLKRTKELALSRVVN